VTLHARGVSLPNWGKGLDFFRAKRTRTSHATMAIIVEPAAAAGCLDIFDNRNSYIHRTGAFS